MRHRPALLPLLPIAALGSACFDQITWGEAVEAIEEAALSAQAEAATFEVIEISTSFTLGEAVEQAAQELADWYRSQVPCSDITVEGNTVTTDFGTMLDNCSYNGHTYAGVARLTIERNDEDEVVVTHEWIGLTSGLVTLDGVAEVTWSAPGGTRQVVHDVSWTSGGRDLHATGDRTQRLLDPASGILGGIRVDGVRDWASSSGDWHLDIDAVEMRGQDPVPQAGTYALTLPSGKVATLSFERIDDDTIRVTVTGGWRDWVFDVSSDGTSVEEA